MTDEARPLKTAPRILLTGRPGCGKTTVIRRAVELIGRERCSGFYTEEVREGGRRIGFDVVVLGGRRGPLARLGAAGPSVGRYGVDLASFESLGVAALEAALEAVLGGAPRILVVDEIGKMELFSGRFVELLERVFPADAPAAVLGTVMRGRYPGADRLRRRPGLRVLEVTPENRNALPRELARLYAEFLASFGGAAG